MAIFSRLYAFTLELSRHRHAPRWLFGVSVAESSFFPVPVDVMLAPMVLAQPHRAWPLATLTTVGSVIGGVIGWFIGMWLIEAVLPLIERVGYMEGYLQAQSWFLDWGFWAVFVAGFTPIPYKVFTIAAGAAGMLLPLFVVASLVGRGARFFLVAALVRWGGPKIEPHLARYADRIGWGVLAACVIGLLLWQLLQP